MTSECIFYCWLNILIFHGCLAYDEGDVRLSAGGAHYGRVEIYHDGEWGNICADHFNPNAVLVICRQLGLPTHYYDVYNGPYPSNGPTTTWLHTFTCAGSELSLDRCTIAHWGVADGDACAHAVSAGAWCGDDTTTASNNSGDVTTAESVDVEAGSIRLAGTGSNSRSGRIELFYGGQWGTVCDVFGDTEARVVCRQLNNTGTHAITTADHFGSGLGPVYELECSGFENHASQCRIWSSACSHSHDAGIICGYVSTQSGHQTQTARGHYKLAFSIIPLILLVCLVVYLIYFKYKRRNNVLNSARGVVSNRRRIRPFLTLKNFFVSTPRESGRNTSISVAECSNASGSERLDGIHMRILSRESHANTGGGRRCNNTVSTFHATHALNPAYPPMALDDLSANQNRTRFSTRTTAGGGSNPSGSVHPPRFYAHPAQIANPPPYSARFHESSPPSYEEIFGTTASLR